MATKISLVCGAVYTAPNEEIVLTNLQKVNSKWGKQYPYATKNREANRDV